MSDTVPVSVGSPTPPDTREVTPALTASSSGGPASATLSGPPHNAGVPHPARVYAYWLGTKDHQQADREAAREVTRHRPQAAAGARANRAFGRRVTWYAAYGCGIRQFLDIGPGLPAPGATHEVAQEARPGSRVVYADNDPVVLAHARALLTPVPGSGTCDYIHADVRDPAGLLARAGAVLDFIQPVAVWLLSVLHYVADAENPAAIVAELAAAVAPGSLIAISHLTADHAPGPVAAAVAAYNAAVPTPVYPRDHAQVTGLFGELPLQWPEVVPVTRWRPSFQEAPGSPCDLYGGVAVLTPPPGQPYRPALGAGRASAQADPDPDDEELRRLAAEFPGHRIWREITSDHISYVARSISLRARPHTLVTASLAEMRAELTAAPQPSQKGPADAR